MVRTMADALKEEGALARHRKLLRELLEMQFGDVPKEVADTVETTTDLEELEGWVKRLVKAKTLKDVGIKRRR